MAPDVRAEILQVRRVEIVGIEEPLLDTMQYAVLDAAISPAPESEVL
jgi:hypothetical protein